MPAPIELPPQWTEWPDYGCVPATVEVAVYTLARRRVDRKELADFLECFVPPGEPNPLGLQHPAWDESTGVEAHVARIKLPFFFERHGLALEASIGDVPPSRRELVDAADESRRGDVLIALGVRWSYLVADAADSHKHVIILTGRSPEGIQFLDSTSMMSPEKTAPPEVLVRAAASAGDGIWRFAHRR